jgi:hypothetical protein
VRSRGAIGGLASGDPSCDWPVLPTLDTESIARARWRRMLDINGFVEDLIRPCCSRVNW